MRLVEQVVMVSAEQAITESTVADDNIFYDADLKGLPAWVGLEYLAQTAAVWLGAECERRGNPIKPAFLLSTREYTAEQPVWPSGERLRVQVRPEWFDLPLVSFVGEVLNYQGEPLVKAVFSAYQPEDFEQYLSASEPDRATYNKQE